MTDLNLIDAAEVKPLEGKWLLSSLQAFWDDCAKLKWHDETSRDPEMHTAYRIELGKSRSTAMMLGPAHVAVLEAFEIYHGRKNRWMGTLAEFEAAHTLPRRPE